MKKLITFAIAAALAFTASAQELDMVKIPGKNFKILRTEVTQELYESIMGENPSYFQIGSKEYEENRDMPYEVPDGEDARTLPVENVSWYDAICFCNRLSEKKGLTPVYSINGTTDVTKWNYSLHKGELIRNEITQNADASGFRLPVQDEWIYAAKGGQNYIYSGSDKLDEVGWYKENSSFITHEVAKKKPNGYGLYDMSGNVWEWCWDPGMNNYRRYICGGSFGGFDFGSEVCKGVDNNAAIRRLDWGFRIVCNAE